MDDETGNMMTPDTPVEMHRLYPCGTIHDIDDVITRHYRFPPKETMVTEFTCIKDVVLYQLKFETTSYSMDLVLTKTSRTTLKEFLSRNKGKFLHEN